MRIAIVGAALLLVGAVAVATGALGIDELGVLAGRTWPILLFVVAITITAELANEAGVFDVVAGRLARWGAGRGVLLWLLVVAFATLSTVFLSLDTTAVLLTPIVVLLAQRAGLDPIPFALTTVWLANTGSLLLPVSNLTNLLAEHELSALGVASGPLEFAALTWAPALCAIVVPVLVIAVVYRRRLVQRYTLDGPRPVADRVLFVWASVVTGALVPMLVTPVPVWASASVAAAILTIVFAVRRRRALRFALVPWRLVVFASGLFVVVEAAHSLAITDVLGVLAGTGEATDDLLRLAGVSAVSANLVNNLPAYLALEPFAGSADRLVAVLVGVGAGPLLTPWASLATLLWHDRVRALGVEVSWWRYAALGLVVAPLTVVAATLAIA
ncbi:SLC13 family permease [Marisediminicola sp. LYQ85]|uniref:SLC13 family permease n=1 Tax=Marisediminicola sp. LYQ85 TaxID=3391062 RepID=UPI003982E5A3